MVMDVSYLSIWIDSFVELNRGEGVGLFGGDGFDVEVGVGVELVVEVLYLQDSISSYV